MDESDRPELMRDLALAKHSVRSGAAVAALASLFALYGFVHGGALLIVGAFIATFFAMVGGLLALDGLRARYQARRSLRELDRMRALPEARVIR